MKLQSLRLIINSVRKFINMGAYTRLWNMTKKLHAVDIASLMDHLIFREKIILFKVLNEKEKRKAAEVISELEPQDAAEILKELPVEQIASCFHLTPSDDVPPVLQYLPEELRDSVLAKMGEKPSEEIKGLLHYEEETAGRIMSQDFYALNQNTNVSDAITAMQLEGEVESAFYLYVVDDENHLVGVVSIRQLLFARPNSKLKDIMNTDLITVNTKTDQEEVARKVADYNLVAIPVLDKENNLLGVVTVDDVIDVLDQEATEDIYKMVSLDTSDRIQDTPFKSIKKRLPFLLFSLLTASLSPFVVNYFKATIEQAVTLAVFMPLVAALGGISGNQTIALMVREIATGQTDWLSSRKALAKEIIVGLGNGIFIGFVIAFISYFLIGNIYIGIILGGAIIINLFVAASLGTLIPLLLRLLHLDPALGSVNLLTMCTDTIGILSFLGLGTLFLNYIS
ncbi:magnesium transporter [bacterium]|nr:magnesium transporter [bacterium]